MTPVIIAVLNLKGGSSKTTTAVNLAACLQTKNRWVTVADADDQQSASRWARQGGDEFPVKVKPISMEKGAKQFKNDLLTLGGDIIVIDCPPAMDDTAMAAALLSNLVLIPSTPSPLDFWATEKAVKMVRDARKERDGVLPHAALIPSRLVSNTLVAREIGDALEQLGEPIGPAIVQRVSLVETAVAGTTINQYAPGSAAHKEFMSLAGFVLKQLRKVK